MSMRPTTETKCHACNGDGLVKAVHGETDPPCYTCHGTGTITRDLTDNERLLAIEKELNMHGWSDPKQAP